MREFEFQVTMLASIRVKAATQVEADRKLRAALAASEANLGMLDNEPIVCAIDVEGDLDLLSEAESALEYGAKR